MPITAINMLLPRLPFSLLSSALLLFAIIWPRLRPYHYCHIAIACLRCHWLMPLATFA